MSRKHDRTGRSKGTDRYVALTHWMMRTDAWRDLRPNARCAYLEISRRYAGPGSNNGRIPCSVREISEVLHVSKMTAMRALQDLEEHAFIVRMKTGAFNLKCRHASEWRLTEFPCDVTGAMATKDFARWTKNQNTVLAENPTGFPDDTERVST